MRYRITLFNPITLKKRVFNLSFTWDWCNKCWDVACVGGLDTRKYYGSPQEFASTFADCRIRKGEFLTIKESR